MAEAVLAELPKLETARPLCVDLDGTLVKSDTLVDSLLVLARNRPDLLWRIPLWLSGGKAALKSQITSAVSLDERHLPYNAAVLDFLREEYAHGRKIYLATGADEKLAVRIANHLGIFEGVLASDGSTNLTGEHKLDGLRRRFPQGGFDYIGNAHPDLPLLKQAIVPMAANPDLRLSASLRTGTLRVQRIFEDRRTRSRAFLRAIRLHQWAKNSLLFVPLLLAHVSRATTLLRALLAFLCFSLFASASYIINDLLDLEADRRHPKKKLRPFASGDLPAQDGVAIVIGFLIAGSAGAWLLPAKFLLWLAAYLVTTLAYSFYLKRIMLVDVIVLSGLYTVRLLAGAAATGVKISPWLSGFSLFLFLSLAMVKRFSELQNLRATGTVPANGRGYVLSDIEQLRSFGTASGYAAVVVFALYISSRDVVMLYRHPNRMWLMTPLLILWISRVWLLASRGELDEDPVVFALTDRMSLLLWTGILAAGLLAL